ncbi:Zinc-binding dehydrogenase [Balamuthia mandrillaris]
MSIMAASSSASSALLSTEGLVLKQERCPRTGLYRLTRAKVELSPFSSGHAPPTPHAVVRIHAVSLNRRDYWIRRGMYPGIRFHSVLGSDASGTVEQLLLRSNHEREEEESKRWIGKRVVLNSAVGWGNDERAPNAETFGVLGMRPLPGTLAERIVVPVGLLAEIPPHLSFEEAACLPVAGLTAWRGLVTKGEVEKGSNVLITGGGGGVATIAAQLAVAMGANVWITSGSDEKLAFLINKLGVKGGVNYNNKDWPTQLEQLVLSQLPHSNNANNDSGEQPTATKKKKSPLLFDCVLDGSGGQSLSSYVRLLRLGGRVVIYGVTAGLSLPDDFNLAVLFLKQVELRGTSMGSEKEWKECLNFVAQHRIVPLVDRVYPFGQYEEAFERLAQHGQTGKIVLRLPSKQEEETQQAVARL